MAKKPTISTTFNAIDKITNPMKKMQQGVKRFAVGAGIALGAASVGIGKLISEASKIEDAVAGFTPLLGGAQKAEELVDKLNKTAATTPFQFEAISDAAKQLLPVMNQDIERTVATFRMLGDTAGGNAQKLDSITRGFTKAMLKNKVDMESLNMIAEAGVPIYTELASSLGVTVAEMMDMSRVGKITSKDLENAFSNMTKEGGIFFNGMEIASQTFSGKMSTLKDNIALTAASIGKQLMPTIKPLLDRGIEIAGMVREWVDNNQALINQKIQDFIKGVTDAAKLLYRLWDSGLIPAIAAGLVTFIAITKAIKTYQAVLQTAKAIQIAFNIAAGANPIGLIILGVTALVAVTVLLIKNWEKVKEVIIGVWEKIKAPFEKVAEFFNGIKGTSIDISEAQSRGMEAAGGNIPGMVSDKNYTSRGNIPGMVSGNSGMISNRSESVSRSYLDVNMSGLPVGSSVKQTGKAPGINVNYAFNGGGL